MGYKVVVIRRNIPPGSRLIYSEVSETIRFVLPDDYGFISLVPERFVKKLRRFGWKLEKVLFFQIPFILIGEMEVADPLPAICKCIDVPKKEVYFRVVVFSDRYLEWASNTLYRLCVKFYQKALEYDEKQLRRGVLTPLYVEELVLEKWEQEELELAFTNPEVRKAIILESRRLYELQNEIPSIFTELCGYWVRELLSDYCEKFSDYAIEFSDEMKRIKDVLLDKLEAIRKWKEDIERRFLGGG